MEDNYSRQELMALGFSEVGDNLMVSRDVRFYAIEGKLGDGVRIDTYGILSGNIELGDNVHISPFCFLSATGGKITMKPNSGIGPHVAILTKSDDYTAADLTSSDKVAGDITVGENCIIGSGCKIFPGSTIGHDASLGSNCIVTGDINPGDIVVSRSASLITVSNRLQS